MISYETLKALDDRITNIEMILQQLIEELRAAKVIKDVVKEEKK